VNIIRRGLYFHTGWQYKYPISVRSWKRSDYAGMFAFLSKLGYNTISTWPFVEAVPDPISDEDRTALLAMRDIISDAQKAGLEYWMTIAANIDSQESIRERPLGERLLFNHLRIVRLDDPVERERYMRHRAELMGILNNADGYITIDGDCGGYPNAEAKEFVDVFLADQKVLRKVGTHPDKQKVIPWLWVGWGSDWENHPEWPTLPVEPHTRPVLALLKDTMTEPWELLPSRSIREGRWNGRDNIALTEEAGMIPLSTLMCYEIIEHEPSPPAVVLQFEDIRRVLRQEEHNLREARGFMGNAQSPLMQLPNLYFVSRVLEDFSYLDRPDEQILADLAAFLGGPADVLVPTWQALHVGLHRLPQDLPASLRNASLTSEAAQLLPGGPDLLLDLLAQMVECRIGVLKICSRPARTEQEAAQQASAALLCLYKWWNVHQFAVAGASANGFRLRYSHPLLNEPLIAFLKEWPGDRECLFASIRGNTDLAAMFGEKPLEETLLALDTQVSAS